MESLKVAPEVGELRANLIEIPSGRAGTKKTLELMSGLVKEGKKNLSVRQTALSLTESLFQKDVLSEIKEIYKFVRDRIRYIKDIRGIETLHSPDRILQLKQGDCDDKSILLCALLETIGIATRFVAVGRDPEKFQHVYVEAKLNSLWLPLETTEPVGIGWQPVLGFRMVKHN